MSNRKYFLGWLLAAFVGAFFGAVFQPAAVRAANGIRGEFSGSVALVPPHKMWYGDFNDATAVQLFKVSNNTIGFGPAGAHFGMSVANKDYAGTCTLGTNCVITFVNAYVAAPVCVGTDQTAAAAVKSAPTTGGVTFTGTGTDVIAYQCDGNPN